MNKYFLLTPGSQDAQAHPDSIFITDGIKYLISVADPSAIFFHVNTLRHDKSAWNYLRENADVVVLCGNSRFNATERKADWDWSLCESIESLSQQKIPVADLWAGASFHQPQKPVPEMASELFKLRKTKDILKFERNVDLKISRDQLAHEILKQSGDDVHLLPCSIWWGQAFHNIELSNKTINCISLPALNPEQHATLLTAVKRLQSHLSKDKPTYVLVHTLSEYDWVGTQCSEIPNLICINDQRSLLTFYAKVDKLVSFCVNESVSALSLGAQICQISIDTGSLALKEFGIESVPFKRIVDSEFTLNYQRSNGPAPSVVQDFVNLFSQKIINRIPAQKKGHSTNDSKLVKFFHGLGDSVYFAHSLPLYKKRGHKLKIRCRPDKHILYKPTGLEIVTTNQSDVQRHPWKHPPRTDQLYPWSNNKAAMNLSRHPMPEIGKPDELWDEYCSTQLDIEPFLSDKSRTAVNSLVAGLPKPLILLHTMGNSLPKRKNLSPEITVEFYKRILDRTSGTIILLDWDNRVPRINNKRVRHMVDDLRRFNTEELLTLMTMSDLLIGIDSGPLHMTRYTKIPAIGIWTNHFPSHFTLPRERTLHTVLRALAGEDKTRCLRIPFNIVEQTTGSEYDPVLLTDLSVRMLEEPRYLPGSLIAVDVQLQRIVEEYDQGVFGCQDYDVLLREISKRYESPVVVDTASVKPNKDSERAVTSTYLFGAFISKYGGRVESVTLREWSHKCAQLWRENFKESVRIHHDHPCSILNSLENGSVDVLYQGCVDSDCPFQTQNCVEELMTAYPKLHDHSIVVCDAAPRRKKTTNERAGLTIPWLFERGWEILHEGQLVILCKTRKN